MRRDLTIIAVALIMILATGSLPCPLSAQERDTVLRVQETTTPEEIGQFLFQATKPGGAEPVGTRGFTPQSKTAVAFNVLFGLNSATIQGQYSADLDKLGQVLTQPQYSTYRVQIEGHTDNVGGRAFNQRLSEKRAESIKSYLVEHFPGIAPERLVTKGYGEMRPRATNDSQEGRDQNRRVEVVNLGR
jgi:outer membrane protein OmpA-like peptidoglycan-associated protein